MDYIFLSSLSGSSINQVIISYDIACQWSVNFWNRTAGAPPPLRLQLPPSNLTFLVPKFHLAAHLSKCQANFSFNFQKNVGRTDGEGVERIWAWMNGIASTTKELGPGGRSDMIDNFVGHNNWTKTIGIGKYRLCIGF
jgi:hypothetical protein